MTLLVKDANTAIQSLSTELDGSGNLVPVHAPASVVAGVASPVGPANPLPVINTAGAALIWLCLPGPFERFLLDSHLYDL